VILGLENMPDNPVLLGKTPREMKRIIEAVRSPHLKMTLDVGHANTTGNLHEFLVLRRHFVNIHLHDNCGQDDHRALGNGGIDLRGFFEGLGSYGGTMILELARVRGIAKSKKIVEGMLGLKT
jgi:sugar phosphate isomerase/epimerase